MSPCSLLLLLYLFIHLFSLYIPLVVWCVLQIRCFTLKILWCLFRLCHILPSCARYNTLNIRARTTSFSRYINIACRPGEMHRSLFDTFSQFMMDCVVIPGGKRVWAICMCSCHLCSFRMVTSFLSFFSLLQAPVLWYVQNEHCEVSPYVEVNIFQPSRH